MNVSCLDVVVMTVSSECSGGNMRASELQIAPKFWEIIDEASRDPAVMRSILELMPRKDLERFNEEFDYAVDDLVSQVEEAGFGSHSSDTNKGIAAWVISQGKPYFCEVFEHPELFPSEEKPSGQSFYGIVNVVYEERFHEAIPEYSGDRWALPENKPSD
jgi:hypothetical protein